MQNRYWRYMVQLKMWLFYVDEYSENSYKWERRINIILAITSSSSIAAWVIWKQFSFIWASLIAISQVITAVKPYLPYGKRLELLSKISGDLQMLFNKADFNWYRVSNGELSEKEINSLLFELKDQLNNTVEKSLRSVLLPDKQKFIKLADEKAEKYFQDTY